MTGIITLAIVDRMEIDVTTLKKAVKSLDLRVFRGSRSQQGLANTAGVSRFTIYQVESGEVDDMKVETLIRVLRAYLGETDEEPEITNAFTERV